jgi:aromatic ring-opening dioxygenase catalytic subunit (LigB family)
MASAASTAMPAIFLSHGGGPCFHLDAADVPMFAGMDKHSKAAAALRNLPKLLPSAPTAIVVVSAHWEGPDEGKRGGDGRVGIYKVDKNSLLFDYYGFPPASYEIKWPTRGDPALASHISDLLKASGFKTHLETTRGLDHGVFVPLKLGWESPPPMLQVSLHPSLDPVQNMRLGAALAPLRSEGVLIVGSGAMTHNLGALRGPGGSLAWAGQFVEAIGKVLQSPPADAFKGLADWHRLPGARKAHPREEHLLPLHVVFGAAHPTAVPGAISEDATPVRSVVVEAPISDDATAGTVEPDGSVSSIAGEKAAVPIYKEMVMGSLSLDSWLF